MRQHAVYDVAFGCKTASNAKVSTYRNTSFFGTNMANNRRLAVTFIYDRSKIKTWLRYIEIDVIQKEASKWLKTANEIYPQELREYLVLWSQYGKKDQ